ncbi:MAG: hypothetical protein HWN67_09135 [Candidatus Helarchaeota archaeon]|nr:hypothetical protein [Candidatus Helarchaeota archaeon]
MIETHLYGRFRSLVPGSKSNEDTVLMCDYKEGETFKEFIERLGLKTAELGDCFINGILAKPTNVLHDGDRVALFPFNMVLLCGGQHLKGHGFTKRDMEIDYY